VHGTGAFPLAEADREHFRGPAFDRASKRRMEFYAVDGDDGVGTMGERVHEDLDPGRRFPERDGVHRRFDRALEGALRDAQMSEDPPLPLGTRGTVRTHCGYDERTRTVGLQFGDEGSDDLGNAGDPATPDCDGDRTLRQRHAAQRRANGGTDVEEFGRAREALLHGRHLRQRNVGEDGTQLGGDGTEIDVVLICSARGKALPSPR
jgi:hypothetical protein